MLKILIVDDELIILNGIKSMIENFVTLDFPVDIKTAANVPEAIAILAVYMPDLLLVDINMPVMNGFDMINYIRDKEYKMDIVILTSHAEFDYARQAVQFQVVDYILKPINMKLLQATIENTYKKIMFIDQGKKKSCLIKLRAMILYDISDADLMVEYSVLMELFPYAYYTVIVAKKENSTEEKSAYLQKILSKYFGRCYAFLLKDKGQMIFLCNHSAFEVKKEKILLELSQQGQIGDAVWGISVCSKCWEELHSLYMNAMQRGFYREMFSNDKDMAERTFFTYKKCVDIFVETENSLRKNRIMDYLEAYSVDVIDADIWERLYKSFYCNLKFYLDDMGLFNEEIQIWEMKLCQDREMLVEKIEELVVQLQKSISENEKKENTVISHLLAYIRVNYQKDISLVDLAEEINMHPNYISALFKRETKQSYLYFLHQERIRIAKKLLESSQRSIGEIASHVGYNSATQLLRIFKKYEHILPSDYRMKLKS